MSDNDTFSRERIMRAFDVTDEDMAALDSDGYTPARAEADRREAGFLRYLSQLAEAASIDIGPLP